MKAKYGFMKAHRQEFRLCAMCRVLKVNRAGYYAWLQSPLSDRAKEDQRLLGLIKHQWLGSGSVYGHRKVTDDLRDLGERCSRHRVHRLMRAEGLRAQVGYGRKPRFDAGPENVAAANLLDRQFDVSEPDTVWASDFTYIRTHEGWMYLAVVIDLFSRQVIGWAMRDRADSEVVLQALLSAVWRRKPKAGVLVHSDQGSVYTSDDWQKFLSAHGLVCSMSRRGNCHDNAPVESFFGLLKRERIKRRIYLTKDAARAGHCRRSPATWARSPTACWPQGMRSCRSHGRSRDSRENSRLIGSGSTRAPMASGESAGCKPHRYDQ